MATDSHSELRPASLVIHGGQAPEVTTGAVMPPIFQTSTYVQPALGEPHGEYDYARVANPTRERLEASFQILEGGEDGIAFASGMAAIEAVLLLLSAGDHVICEDNVYGGTQRLFRQVFEKFGIAFEFVDTRDPDRVAAALTPKTKLVFVETPTNPMMRITPIAAIAELAHGVGALLCVDNTFASPINQRPIDLGADIVVHSTTKYLNGHSDVIGGAAITRTVDLGERLRFIRKCSGAVPGPWDCWLCLRGIKTLHIRIERHNQNGGAIAEYLQARSDIEDVHYPGLPSHPQHELARSQMMGFGGMVSFELGSPARARTFSEATRIFQLAESLGGVESLVGVPAIMTHASVPEDKRAELGVTEGLVRLSVGIEAIEDLVEDLDRAFSML